MRIMFLGLRGFPDVQGGVETHAQQLCLILAELGCEVDVLLRSPYMPVSKGDEWRGVRNRRIWSPRSRSLEAPVHTMLGVLYAGFVRRPDVLHIHAIGPAVLTPLARLLGLRVVVTHHGPDYDRQKWGRLAKRVLLAGERWGMRWSQGRIVISEGIRSLVKEKHRVDSALIPNGVELPGLPDTVDALRRFGLTRGRYVLMVSRLVPEKRHLDLLEAFSRSGLDDWKLALVGAADHPDDYQRAVVAGASATRGAVMTGFQSGRA